MKNPSAIIHIIGQKSQFCQNYTLLWAKRFNRMPIFSIFHEKFNALVPILRKNRSFCEKHVNRMPIFCRKNVQSLKTRSSHFIRFKFFMKKPLAFMHKIGTRKRQFSQNYTLLWAKKVLIGCPYFPSFLEKISVLMPIFCQKTSVLLKQTALISIFCQKNVHSLKKMVLSWHIFNSFHKKPYCHVHIWSKNVDYVKTILL